MRKKYLYRLFRYLVYQYRLGNISSDINYRDYILYSKEHLFVINETFYKTFSVSIYRYVRVLNDKNENELFDYVYKNIGYVGMYHFYIGLDYDVHHIDNKVILNRLIESIMSFKFKIV